MSIPRTFARRRSTAERAVERLSLGLFANRRVPLILQTDAAESGLACIAMVAAYHGHTLELAELRARHPAALRGMTAEALFEAAAGLDLVGQARSVDRTELSTLKLPCVLHWGDNHFVVLKKMLPGRGGLLIHDPAIGEVRVRRSEFAKRYLTIVALEFKPGREFAMKDSARPSGLAWLTGRMRGLGGSAMQLVLLALALQAFALAPPLLMQWAIDGGIGSQDRQLIQLLAWGLGLLVGVQATIGVMRSWVVLYTVSHINLQWLTNSFTHLLRLPAHFFDRRTTTDVADRFRSIQSIQKSIGTGLVEGLVDGLLAGVLVGVMAVYSPLLAGIAFAFAAAYAALRWATYRPLKRATEQQLTLAAREGSFLVETIERMQAIKLFNQENARRSRWLDTVVDSMNRLLATQKLSLGLQGARTMLGAAQAALLLWLAAGMAIDGVLTLGMLFALASFALTFSQRAHALVDGWVELQMLRLQGDRLTDIVLSPAERTSGSANLKPLPDQPTLEMRNVSFRYADGEPWVLRDINLAVAAGEAVAIVGPSGCGKTTLVKLMLGLLKPTQGEVLYGGVPIDRIGARTWRKMVGAVMQEDDLFAGTVLENIALADARPHVDRAVSCADAAAIADEIERLPLGYRTRVGGGLKISSGQKQRLLLARALYKRPKVLVLDEATSHVDGRRLNVINEGLRDMTCTRIVVAHRVDAIRGVPRVIVLEEGTVAKDLSSVLVTVTDAVERATNDSQHGPLTRPGELDDAPVLQNIPVLRKVLKLR